MYSFLKGELVEINDTNCVLDVNGVGFLVNITKKEAAQILTMQGKELTLFVELIVREDSHSLYGFAQKSAKELFKILIQLSGIGPKVALNILSELSPEELSRAILTNDIVKLTSISGIGKKTAERMIIDLKDKIKNFSSGDISVSENAKHHINPEIEEELTSALTALGYRSHEIKRIIQNIKVDNIEDLKLEELIKLALKASSY
ncbi:MAG: Holliday junction branch migration protein RuvA [Candidatus Margulisbacteria bacterium]|nr:Holliday junction branch migration protein RuvA [Candidatus Margulisiibacteriota bacterium]